MISYLITKKDANQRVDKFVKKQLNDAPLSFIYKIFRKKDVKVNSHWVKIDYILKENDELKIYVSDEQLKEFSSPKDIYNLKFSHEIIYEDENILIINKPRHLLVHGDNKEKKYTLANEVISYLYNKGEYNGENGYVPSPTHRLDRNTSGAIIFAKNLISQQELEELFKDKKEIEKHYYALSYGKAKESDTISLPLLKDPNTNLVKVDKKGKEAITIYNLVDYKDNYSLLDVNLITGRTHQIRVHLSNKNLPIVGDNKYGNFEINKKFLKEYKFSDQFLHAYKISFKDIKGHLSYLSNKTFIAKIGKEEKELLTILGLKIK